MSNSFIRAILLVASISMTGISFAQSDFRFHLQEVPLSGFQGVQSFAVGEHAGLWMVVGGRTDGLHRRQPFASFDAAGGNNKLQVVNPETGQVWSVATSSLPVSVAEQLAGTNAQFIQRDSILYLIGGYGYSALEGDHVTFPYIIAMDLPGVIQAVQNGNSLAPFIRQSAADERIRVTGGVLIELHGDLYLAGGQKFMGRYNPMGPTHGPGFEQVYTDAIRRFKINDNGTALSLSSFSEWVSAQYLHRRDYNAIPQIFPDGREEFFNPMLTFPGSIRWMWTVPATYPTINSISCLISITPHTCPFLMSRPTRCTRSSSVVLVVIT